MSSTNERIEDTFANRDDTAIPRIGTLLAELRALTDSHLEAGLLALEASGIRLAFALALIMLAVFAVVLAWAIGCGVVLYALALATSVLWAVVVGILIHLALAFALFRFACGEIDRIKTYFSAAVPAVEPR